MSDTKTQLIELVGKLYGSRVKELAAEGEAIFNRSMDQRFPEGMDSLDRMEFVMNVEDAFDIEIPDAKIVDASSIDDIVGVVDEVVATQRARAR